MGGRRTITYDIPILVFSDLEERRPFRMVLHVETELVRLGVRVEVAFGELVDVVRLEPPEVRHGLWCVVPSVVLVEVTIAWHRKVRSALKTVTRF